MTVLFVDDEPQVLRGLERMLDAAEVEWDAEFVNNITEAMERLAQDDEIDTVVTDMRMPGMDGAKLLEDISKKYPHVVRIVLSGQADKEAVFRAVSPMHQYLSKPCDAEKLRTTIHRATALLKTLNSKSLQKVAGSISNLPSVPLVYQQVVDELQKEDSSITAIGEIIAQDISMTAKILQLTNSAVFGLRNQVTSAVHATTLLGVDTIKSLVLTAGVFQEFEEAENLGFSIDSLMQHSLKVAALSKQIAAAENMEKEAVDAAYTAGVLHDIGKLVLLAADSANFFEAIKKSQIDQIPSWQAERDIFGTDHAGIGAHLLSIWGIPQSIIEVVALHHTPVEAGETEFSLITAVASSNELNHEDDQPRRPSKEFEDYLEHIECLQKFESWKNLCS